MNATQEQYDELAKVFQAGDTGDIDGWDDLAIDPDYMSDDAVPVPTRETLDDFRRAAKHDWNESSTCQEICGGLFWSNVQARKGDRREALAVIDCGDFRLAYKQ